MDKQEWKQFVLRFLKENKVFSEYMKLSKEHFIYKHENHGFLIVNENNIIESLFDLLRNASIERNLIHISFLWKRSFKESSFWFNLNEKFKKEYDKRIEQEKKEKKEREKYKNHNKEEELTNKIYERILRNNIFGYGTIINNGSKK